MVSCSILLQDNILGAAKFRRFEIPSAFMDLGLS
jgi:hypothetical protein